MKTMFQPCIEIPNKRQKSFDSTLCIVCQKVVAAPKRGPKRIVVQDHFDVFIEVCKELKKSDDERYLEIQQEIGTKTAKQLYDDKYCFHTQCRSEFQKISGNQKQKLLQSKGSGDKSKEKSCSSTQEPKVSRQDTISFDKNLCLFCQIDEPGIDLFSVCQTSRDRVIKDAFSECPRSLALYIIRSSHAYDAMAVDKSIIMTAGVI